MISGRLSLQLGPTLKWHFHINNVPGVSTRAKPRRLALPLRAGRGWAGQIQIQIQIQCRFVKSGRTRSLGPAGVDHKPTVDSHLGMGGKRAIKMAYL